MSELWVVNPLHVPKKIAAHDGDYDRQKRYAEIRMARYDRLPKSVRRMVNEYGMLADACLWQYAAQKIEAVKKAYRERLERSAIKLDK